MHPFRPHTTGPTGVRIRSCVPVGTGMGVVTAPLAAATFKRVIVQVQIRLNQIVMSVHLFCCRVQVKFNQPRFDRWFRVVVIEHYLVFFLAVEYRFDGRIRGFHVLPCKTTFRFTVDRIIEVIEDDIRFTSVPEEVVVHHHGAVGFGLVLRCGVVVVVTGATVVWV